MKSIAFNGLRAVALAGAALVTSVTASGAATVLVETEAGVAMVSQDGIRPDTGARGIDLAGAVVTVTFKDGTTDTKIWQAFDTSTTGGLNGTDGRWGIFQGANDQVALMADGSVITTMVIDTTTSNSTSASDGGATPDTFNGPALFDITSENEDFGGNSTAGSSFGFPFSFTFNEPACSRLTDPCVIVTYSGEVSIGNDPAVGDLYTTMTVDFSGLDAGGFTGQSTYTSDVDVLRTRNDLRPLSASVPLPAALPLLLVGLGGLRLLRRRKEV